MNYSSIKYLIILSFLLLPSKNIFSQDQDSIIRSTIKYKRSIGISFNPYISSGIPLSEINDCRYSLRYSIHKSNRITYGGEIFGGFTVKNKLLNEVYTQKYYSINPSLFGRLYLHYTRNVNLYFESAVFGSFKHTDAINDSIFNINIKSSDKINAGASLSPGIRFHFFPFELYRRISIDVMARLSYNDIFTSSNNTYYKYNSKFKAAIVYRINYNFD
ncbi:MAG TPA: hypothetical protein PKK00_05010 [Bacteroidales bacterium]|nr:hypothetical protein [Bacteroidales bacterium]HPS16719.1 hypothetical protein [Bacteroidales bacterium]